MIRSLIAAVALSLAGVSAASAPPPPCLDTSDAWSVPFSQGQIRAVTYYVSEAWLAVVWAPTDLALYVGVPVTVAQRFQATQTADTIYSSFVKGRFRYALLGGDKCALLSQLGTPLTSQ